MKNLVILGAGTAGTLLANKLVKKLKDWNIVVVDRDDEHHYQPGYLFIPFEMYTPKQVVKRRGKYLPDGVEYVIDEAAAVDREARTVTLKSGRVLSWDQLIITTGTEPRPEEVEGMVGGADVHSFYTLESATALAEKLKTFEKGRLLVQVCEMPIKCPVAPLEFALLAQDFMRKRKRDWEVEIVFVTPLDGAFTKPVASNKLGHLMADRGIKVVTDFQIESVGDHEILSFDGRSEKFDLLVTIPPNRGAKFLGDLGDDAGFVPVNKHTLQSDVDPDIWVVGDASNVPTSKAGSVVHFEVESFVPNFLAHLEGKDLPESFDGHANCFIESGRGEAMLLDFNYEQEPVTGVFPLSKVGPLKLLAPSVINHVSKLAFEHVYWHMLIKGIPLPFPRDMPTAGKDL